MKGHDSSARGADCVLPPAPVFKSESDSSVVPSSPPELSDPRVGYVYRPPAYIEHMQAAAWAAHANDPEQIRIRNLVLDLLERECGDAH